MRLITTTGKYVAGRLRDFGFNVSLAGPYRLSIIFKFSKRDECGNSYKLTKLRRLNSMLLF